MLTAHVVHEWVACKSCMHEKLVTAQISNEIINLYLFDDVLIRRVAIVNISTYHTICKKLISGAAIYCNYAASVVSSLCDGGGVYAASHNTERTATGEEEALSHCTINIFMTSTITLGTTSPNGLGFKFAIEIGFKPNKRHLNIIIQQQPQLELC